MKRHIAIPLLCVVLVAALSFPVYATSLPEIDSPTFPYPENYITGQGTVTFTYQKPGSPYSIGGSEPLNFGEMWIGNFIDLTIEPYFTDYAITATYSFTLTVMAEGSFYVACEPGSLRDFTPLNAYRDESLDYTVNFGDEWPVKCYRPNISKFDYFSETATVSILFMGYKDVPAGSYNLNSVRTLNTDGVLAFGVYASGNGSGGSGGSGTTDPDNPGTGGGSGATGDSGYQGFNNIVDQFQNGNITYTDALDQLGDRYDFINTTDIYQNLLYVNEYQMSVSKLNGLVSSSAAEKSSDLDAQMSATVDQFADGSIDLKGAMDALQSDFSTALSGAQTVEEAQAATAVYQVKLRQLETQNQVKLMEGFDVVISDEDIQKADDYYAAEDELVNAFDVADFDAQLQFDLWWLQMPESETIQYKKFFDYLMNESDIKYFITIPLAMSLVAIIMGTRMRTRPDRVVERSTTVDSGGSRTTTVKYKND